jgi:hypothetical protein
LEDKRSNQNGSSPGGEHEEYYDEPVILSIVFKKKIFDTLGLSSLS